MLLLNTYVDLVKHDVLTLVGDTPRCRNGRHSSSSSHYPDMIVLW